jgi:phenylalanyl-tRNA synthetase beta subunit
VEDADGKVTVYPDISPRELETTVDYITSSIGIECEAEEIVKLLSRMSLTSKLLPDKKTIKVSIPCTRSGECEIYSLTLC